jgi:hypothetical protein
MKNSKVMARQAPATAPRKNALQLASQPQRLGSAPIIEHAVVEQIAALPFDFLTAWLQLLDRHGESFTAGCVVTDIFGKSHEGRSVVGDGFAIFEAAQKHDTRLHAGIVMCKCELRQAHHSRQRTEQLPYWLHRYNWHTPHTGIGAKTPISRLGLAGNNLLRLHI